jgi:hypothetical protein
MRQMPLGSGGPQLGQLLSVFAVSRVPHFRHLTMDLLSSDFWLRADQLRRAADENLPIITRSVSEEPASLTRRVEILSSAGRLSRRFGNKILIVIRKSF